MRAPQLHYAAAVAAAFTAVLFFDVAGIFPQLKCCSSCRFAAALQKALKQPAAAAASSSAVAVPSASSLPEAAKHSVKSIATTAAPQQLPAHHREIKQLQVSLLFCLSGTFATATLRAL